MMDSDPARVVTVLMTAPDADTAEALARTLVTERLAACANIVPSVVSIYRWEGEIKRDSEVMLVLKTTAGKSPEVARRAVELHPYDVPEVLVLPVEAGHAPYLSWVGSEVED
jgi:periplasmic divalent cation tolerance protein